MGVAIVVVLAPTALAQDRETVARAAVFAQAHRDRSAGRRSAARAGFSRSVESVPELADHALFHAAALARESGDVDAATRDYDRLLRDHPRSVWVSSAATDRGEIDLERGAPAAALGHFDVAIRAWESRSRTRAVVGKARALEALGRFPEAYSLAVELAGRPGPPGREARTLRERLEARGPGALGLSPTRMAEQSAEARLAEGRADEALVALRPALAGDPPGRVLLLHARILQRAGRAEEAREAQGRAAASGDRAVAAQALSERARIAWNANRDEEAAADFRLVVERFPDREEAAEAWYALGRIAEAAGRPDEAASHYEAVARRHPHSKVAEESVWRAAFVRYRNGSPAAAAAAWAAIDGRDDALYWSGRAWLRAGRESNGREAFERLARRSPRGYYAWWIDRPERFDRTPDAPLPVPSTLPAVARGHLERARLLRAIGLRDDAMRELAGADNAAAPPALLLREYEVLGAHRQTIRLASRLRSQGVRGLERRLRPLAHESHFREAGRKYGVDPLLLMSIARQESLFDERIASPADAQGVMQLLPATASSLVGRPVQRAELWSPALNIDLGARYFRQMLDRFQGKAIPAIAAYNAGPSAAQRWIEAAPGRSGDEFVELISYRETRGYVKAVLENYRAYRSLYGSAESKALPLF